MQNGLFISPWYSDLASLSVAAGGEAVGFPRTNLQNYRPGKVWRTTSVSAQSLGIDFGSGVTVAATALALVGANHGSGGTWSIGGSNTDAASAIAAANLVTAGTTMWPGGKPSAPNWPYKSAFAFWTNVTGYRYLGIAFSNSAAASYYEAGRLIVAQAFQPGFNFDLDYELSYVSADAVTDSDWNQTLVEKRGYVKRRLALTWSGIDRDEVRAGAMQLARQVGGGGDFFFCWDPSDTSGDMAELSFQCKFDGPSGMPRFRGARGWINNRQAYAFTCTLIEIL